MKWLTLALLCEGATDLTFLRKVIYREALRQVLKFGDTSVEIQEEVIFIDKKPNDERSQSICDHQNIVDIFAIHSDSTRNSRDRIRDSIFSSINSNTKLICNMNEARIVPVMPVREMEAWILADARSIALACGYEAWPANKPLNWQERQAEDIEDPKQILKNIIQQLAGDGALKSPLNIHIYLEQIADKIDISNLLTINSYKEFSNSLNHSLKYLRIIPNI